MEKENDMIYKWMCRVSIGMIYLVGIVKVIEFIIKVVMAI